MMGYSLTQKGYRLLNLQTKTFFFNIHVKFVEPMFPFKATSKDDDNIFMHQPINIVDTNLNFMQLVESFKYIVNSENHETLPGNVMSPRCLVINHVGPLVH